MIIVLKPHPSDEDVKFVEEKVRATGYEPHTICGAVRTVVAAVGDETAKGSLEFMVSYPMVENVIPVQKKYKLISRETHPEHGIIRVRGLEIGGDTFHVVAGPCSVESRAQLLDTARGVKEHGASMLRGGAYKPRTSPYAFQGLGEKGLELLLEACAETGLPIVTEIINESNIAKVAAAADVLQIGARNALNYTLLEAVADTGKPILLKRGIAATIEEWLLAAEYIVKKGNRQVILCERGIRTFETATRNTLDVSAIAIARRECSLPVFADPSHAAGRWDLIGDLSKAAIAAGANGLLVEVHRHPEVALSDGGQQITPDAFGVLMREIAPFVQAAGKKMHAAPAAAGHKKTRAGWGH